MLAIDALPFLGGAVLVVFLWALLSGSTVSLRVFFAVSAPALADVFWLAWFFRDGMGPDAVTTSGWKAVHHFMLLASIPVCLWGLFAFTLLGRRWWATRQRPNNSFKPKPLRGSA